ncbi:hypoxanthine-guanine phosphoribosyltransferase [Solemya elarraichensis gill symbiont]|uniref:Hypoxanthine-guanine phosphoribosyltransferase n=2 Tax=Solemya elarraichensis gill symbiont TaxID=1918949 RepID=A0A1T2L3H7_9GAMM|nr:hypoxanthine-guanine phosphoribosyltransferase [Solemya elarraichensis gill symbiont]
MAGADCLFASSEVDAAIDSLAKQLNERFAGLNPVVLCVMNGGLVISGQLLPRLSFQLQFDYMHATRYRDQTSGGELQWKRHHEISLKDRVVLVLDDILDEGETLKSVYDACLAEGAKEVLRVVLVEKIHDRNIGVSAEYTGLQVPDRYVFGYGMDYKGYWRNAKGIFAVAENESGE